MQLGRGALFNAATLSVLAVFTALSLARIAAVQLYYKAPMDVAAHFAARELPELAVRRSPQAFPDLAPHLGSDFDDALRSYKTQIDLSSLESVGLTICWGKEWFRYPGSYLVPSVVEPRFVKSAFAGMIPKPFTPRPAGRSYIDTTSTRLVPSGFNDRNLEVLENYVRRLRGRSDPQKPIAQCDYLVDLDFPHRYSKDSTTSDHILEPRYPRDAKKWERVVCFPFLDANHSPLLSRTLFFPLPGWRARNKYGDYCLLKSKSSRKLRLQ